MDGHHRTAGWRSVSPWRAALIAGVVCWVGHGATAGTANTVAPSPTAELQEPLLIARDDGTWGIEIAESLPLVRASLLVTPNVVGIARRNAAVETPPIDAVPRSVFRRVHFEPREGFRVDEDGEIIVDDDPSRVSYAWYGRSGSDHLLLTVVRGQVRGMVYGPGRRLGIGSEGRRTVLRAIDADAVDAGGCASNRIRDLPDFGSALRSQRRTDSDAPPAGDDSTAGTGPESKAARGQLARPKYGARIGVLFYYTTAAEQFRTDPNDPDTALGVTGLQAMAASWIDQVNTTLRNSGDPYHVQIEQIGPVTLHPTYTELTAQQQPDADLRYTGHLLFLRDYDRFGLTGSRPDVGADFAILMVADSGNPNRRVWGAAYTQRNNCVFDGQCDVGDGVFPVGTGTYRNHAYAALTVNPEAQNLTFSHEIGHMLGSNHDPNVEYPAATLRGA